MESPSRRLQELLQGLEILLIPCCFDALSSRLIEAARLASPDTGLISYGEMVDQGRDICAAVSIPVIGDGDTGYGNPANVKRTVHGYAAASFAGIMIEDQLAPKRCGHTRGKEMVDRREALQRLQAATDAREEGADILISVSTPGRSSGATPTARLASIRRATGPQFSLCTGGVVWAACQRDDEVGAAARASGTTEASHGKNGHIASTYGNRARRMLGPCPPRPRRHA